ncbi:MAG: hypothetical protein JWL60_1668 [Gemmatimonadetes bacterium]|jgi:hypothetical protein|nr:hypothetical protein [Gemmatimonadota bacterium]
MKATPEPQSLHTLTLALASDMRQHCRNLTDDQLRAFAVQVLLADVRGGRVSELYVLFDSRRPD